MRRMVMTAAFAAVGACAFSSAATADVPTVSLSFANGAPSIGSTDPLTFTIAAGATAASGMSFVVDMPAGLNATAASSPGCGGTVTTTPSPAIVPPINYQPGIGTAFAPYDIQLSGGSLAAGTSCAFTVPVLVEGAGSLTVYALLGTPWFTPYSDPMFRATPDASVTVPATALPPTITTAFAPPTVAEHATTTWTLTITNPNAAAPLTGLRFFQPVLPVGQLSPEALTGNTCGGTGLAAADGQIVASAVAGPLVAYSGGSLAPGARCTITVTMATESPFRRMSVPIAIDSNEGGPSQATSALLTSLAPDTTPVSSFTHSAPRATAAGVISETVTLPGRGRLRAGETWRGRLIAHAQRTVGVRRTVKLTLTPDAATRRALKSHHGAALRLSLTYTPSGGRARTITVTARTPRRR